jgi:hypothetical protein
MKDTRETTVKSSEQLYREWREHRHFRYRGCAPDADDPLRMAGNPDLPVGAHHGPDAWVPEDQKTRVAREDAAIKVCLSCPVMMQCDAYASSVTADGKLAEPDGVWGARRAKERKDAFAAKRHEVAVAAPDRLVRTPQKQSVLLALAMCTNPLAVAEAAGVDVRTANWQRSRLVTQLNLCKKTATRLELLAEAVRRGLLDGSLVVPDDGSVPAVPPPTKLPAPAEPVAASELGLMPVEAAPGRVCRRVGSRRRRVTAVPVGQLSFDDALAPVVSLFRTVPLGAAA